MARIAKTTVTLGDAVIPVSPYQLGRLSPVARAKLEPELLPEPLANVKGLDLKGTWVESPLGRDWIVAYRILSEHGAPIVGEIRVFPNEPERVGAGQWSAEFLGSQATAPPGGITGRVLGGIRLSEPLKAAGELLRRLRIQDPGSERTLAGRGLATTTLRRRGRKGHGDRFYAQVAQDYVSALEAGSMSPATDVARRRRLGSTGPARIRDLLHEARRRNLLTPATARGRRGQADLTPRGRMILADVPADVPATTSTQPHSTPRQPRAKKKPTR